MSKNLSRLIALLLLAITSIGVSAQDLITVSGTIYDSELNEPIIGATVLVKGQKTGAVSDIDGKYTVGLDTKEEKINGRTNIDVYMTANSQVLDEVVVVGYGVQRKSDVTGSISSISGKDVNNTPVSSALQALQGKASGVNVIQNSGSPGGATTIKIRGTGTVNDADPLYVVDGFIVDDITHISPNDIASIEILKDAASSAVYGARAANGVVAITTKSGESGKVSITVDAYFGVSNPWKKIDVMGVEDYALMKDYINGTTTYSQDRQIGGMQ